ncbi:hypothetical protein [Legionella nagasakiensis]|uniref:hypothetical protein n=1 Tax=Legionella nagasakiensis TaxID=535290 RepID=UPI001055FB6E|nr:hypothetical protein [Legionella nagasakiensis]
MSQIKNGQDDSFLRQLEKFESSWPELFQHSDKTSLNVARVNLASSLRALLTTTDPDKTDQNALIVSVYIKLLTMHEKLSSMLPSAIRNKSATAEKISSCRDTLEAMMASIEKESQYFASPMIRDHIRSIQLYNKEIRDIKRSQVFKLEAMPTRADLENIKRNITGVGAYLYIPSANHALYYLSRESSQPKKLNYQDKDAKNIRFILRMNIDGTVPELQQALLEKNTRYYPKSNRRAIAKQVEILLRRREKLIEDLETVGNRISETDSESNLTSISIDTDELPSTVPVALSSGFSCAPISQWFNFFRNKQTRETESTIQCPEYDSSQFQPPL